MTRPHKIKTINLQITEINKSQISVHFIKIQAVKRLYNVHTHTHTAKK